MAEDDLTAHNQLGSYMRQSSSGPVWMSGDSMWPLPPSSSSSSSNFCRGGLSTSGLHFVNFPKPMALLPGNHQLGTGSGGGSGVVMDGHLGMLMAVGTFRPPPGTGGYESQGSDRHETSHHF